MISRASGIPSQTNLQSQTFVFLLHRLLLLQQLTHDDVVFAVEVDKALVEVLRLGDRCLILVAKLARLSLAFNDELLQLGDLMILGGRKLFGSVRSNRQSNRGEYTELRLI